MRPRDMETDTLMERDGEMQRQKEERRDSCSP